MFEAGIRCAIFREEMDLAGVLRFVDDFDGTGPREVLAVVDLAEIEQGFLDGSAACHAAVFHDAPVTVLFAVFQAFVATQKHIDLRKI